MQHQAQPPAINPLFAHALQTLQNKPSLTAQKLQVFNSRIGKKEMGFMKEVLTTHMCVRALLLMGVSFSNPKHSTELLLQLRNTELVSLQMKNTPMPASDVLCLAAVIQETKLRTLELINVQVADQGAVALASALHHCYSLRTLNLWGNQLSGLSALAIASKLGDSSIFSLDIGNNPIGVEAMCAFAEHLPKCALRRLCLSDVGMGNEGFRALCGVLPQCADLEWLDVARNGLEQECVDELALVINQSPKLRHLDLSANLLSSLAPLSTVLGCNAVLECLDVHGNRGIQDDSLIEFASKALASHATLAKMDVTGTRTSPAIRSQFQEKLVRLHDPRSKVMCTLASVFTVRRLGRASMFANQVPPELLRMLCDVL